ncbi:hypothetical protein N7456_009098 [Penicillium angulare]|uniref:Uncharacterized protein n=1 Tax=Penicillium angulare TaxID=116970 RepID=A0A9W9F464_9EURO|nr:hypothetical protein N7456_009098 [Penicillium angulare]
MTEFPALKPAFTMMPMVGGTLKSADGFSPAIEAEFAVAGQNSIHADSDRAHNRPDAHSILKYV